jgi:hypothetical protein
MADNDGITPAEFGTAFKRFVDAMNAEAAKETSPLVERLRQHLGGDPGRMPIVSEDFDNYEHPNVQVALDKSSIRVAGRLTSLGSLFRTNGGSSSRSRISSRPATHMVG